MALVDKQLPQEWLLNIMNGDPVMQHRRNPERPGEWIEEVFYPQFRDRLDCAKTLLNSAVRTERKTAIEENFSALFGQIIENLPN